LELHCRFLCPVWGRRPGYSFWESRVHCRSSEVEGWQPMGVSENQSPEEKLGGPDPGELAARAERFATLLGGAQRKLFLFILSFVPNPADAEDILQETNLVLWRKFDDFRPGTDFTRWACKVAFYEVLKHRQAGIRKALPLSEGTMALVAQDAEEALGEADSRREALFRCLEKLREPIRRMLRLRYQLGADTRAVAEAVGRSVEATRRALHRARVALLRCIQRELARQPL
jgi:RNA polymerase sigma-70 factor (ECF subfamily)